MNQQIRIPTNGAGEVRVCVKRQAEVTIVDRCVHRLLHGAKQHHVDLLGLRTIFGRLRDGLEFAGLRVVAHSPRHAHGAQVIAQYFNLLRGWAFVDTIQTGMLTMRDEFRRADVGGQHGFFNKPVCIRSHARHDAVDPSGLIGNDLRLDRVKVNGAPTLASLQQAPIDIL